MAIITALKLHKRRRERVQVTLDGAPGFSLSLVLAARLRTGQTLDAAEIARLQAEDEIARAEAQAARTLARRPRSGRELRRKLQQKGYSEEAMTAALERMRQQGYVDDEAFARFWVAERMRFRPTGLMALRHELRQKGVDGEIIEAALAGVDSGAAARRAARGRLRRQGKLRGEQLRKSLWGFLQRRGFEAELCREVVGELLEEAGEGEASSAADGQEEQASWRF